MQPYPNRNSVLVMDNATIHHRGVIERLCEEVGVLLLYLSPTSPDFNPIERTFKVLKDRLRRNGFLAWTVDRLGCMRKVMSDVCTSSFIMDLYTTCGYRARVVV
jgi:transposase